MVGRMFHDVHRATDPFVFWLWFFVEMCADLFVFSLLRGLRRRDTGGTTMCLIDCPKGVKKIFSELMWSMWSVAMLIRCALCSFGTVYCPFEYGIVALFALPRMKKPPDLVSEGDGHIRCSRSLFSSSYDSKYDYFIARQRYLAKQLRMHQLNKAVRRHYMHRARRPDLMPPLKETSADRLFEKQIEKEKDLCDCDCYNLCSNDVPLGDAHKDISCAKRYTTDFNSI